MDVSVSNLKSKVLVKINGSVNLTEAEALSNPFEKVLKESEKDVIVDLSHCLVMSTLGVGKIIFLNNRLESQNRSMIIKGIHEKLKKLFTAMKLHLVLNMHEK